MAFGLSRLVAILAGTMLIGGIAIYIARGAICRSMLTGIIGGLALFSGIGASAPEVMPVYIVYYFIFLVAMILGFHLIRPVFLPTSRILGLRLPPILTSIDNNSAWLLIIAMYLAIAAFPLVWPKIRLHQLFSPPPPNLRETFFRRFTEEPSVISKLVEYGRFLLAPFFFIALYRLRFRLWRLVAVIGILLYLEYVSNAYIGRGTVIIYLSFIFLIVWFLHPQFRFALVILAAAATPGLLYAFYWYARMRLGGAVGGIGFGAAISALLSFELGFPSDVGMPILQAGARVNLNDYFTWILTLPIPKLITGPIKGARINYEISEIILGLPTGVRGWYVVLPGLIAESVYIYGPFFFWLHGLFIGGIASFFVRLTERVPHFLFLFFYILLKFCYVLNRGGIAAFLPQIINEFLLFYLFLVFAVIRFPYLTQGSQVARWVELSPMKE